MGAYWDSFISGVLRYAEEGYSSLDPWHYPLFFCGIIAFGFFATRSIMVGIVFILVVVGVYGSSVFVAVPDLTTVLYIVALIGIAALFTTLFIKRRG